MIVMRSVFAAFLALVPVIFLGPSLPVQAREGVAAQVRTEQVQAQLLAWAPQGVPLDGDGAENKAPVWVGLQITHQPGWHTYWKNSGDSGLPTQLQWRLPAGVAAGEIAWPVPAKIPIGDLANYGYEGTVLLPVPLTIHPDFRPGPLADGIDIRLRASWLVCRLECIPQDGEFAITLPLNGSTALHGAAFEAALARQPVPLTEGTHEASVAPDRERLALRVDGLPEALRGQPLELFPETPGIIVAAAKPGAEPDERTWTQRWEGTAWTADLPLSSDRATSPGRLPLVLVAADGRGWRAEAQVSGAWPSLAPIAGLSPALEAALQANAAAAAASTPPAVPWATFILALLGALVGGAILNLMPCVFPVLAVKVLGFAKHGGDRRAHRISGLAYSAGVVLSFVALGALMLALRAAGQQLGWGFQLQSPVVVAALATLFVVIGLNLAGVFEFGQFLPSRLATLRASHPVVDSALAGVLAVAVASPCTAPFMGASLGLAVGLPAGQALAVFAALGLGMALPYLAASWLPAVARALPRPGAWMETLRQFLAFPMFGTAVWLLWVLGQQSGIDGAGALLALWVALALILWALSVRGRARVVLTAFSLVLGAILLVTMGPHMTQPMPQSAPAQATHGARWAAWSPDQVQAALGSGRPVFVDFTAAWCVTCQVNKKTTLTNAEVLAAFDAAGVQTFRADWTRRDAAIAAELRKLGRSGVPAYVLQAPGKDPVVLSEILSVSEIREALARL